MHADLALRNRQLMGKLLVVTLAMLGFAFAMVPMYRQVCEALGITATRAVGAANTQVDTSREIEVELLASSSQLPWRFEAIDKRVEMHPGELKMVRFRVTNTLGRPVTAQAMWRTAPDEAAQWIQKQTCFCFSNQTLAPGETREMPVVFRVRADAPRDLELITMSYTFFEVPKAAS